MPTKVPADYGSVIQMFDAEADWMPAPNFTTSYVEDCDAVYERALKAGATSVGRSRLPHP